MGDVYLGIEHILRRISKFKGENVPSGEHWHAELFERFCAPTNTSVPVFFEDRWIERTDSFRRFRHVTHYGYALDLEWNRVRNGLKEARPVFNHFRDRVEQFLAGLDEEPPYGGDS